MWLWLWRWFPHRHDAEGVDVYLSVTGWSTHEKRFCSRCGRQQSSIVRPGFWSVR